MSSILTSDTDKQQPLAPTPTRKRATSFIKKKPPLERGLSAQSALRVNKNALISDGHPPEVIITKPSPEQQILPMSLKPENSTLVHVLVHRESEEYKDDGESGQTTPIAGSSCMSTDKFKATQIHINTAFEDTFPSDETPIIGHPVVQIMVDSPKEPPTGDFSDGTLIANADIDKPIDVNVQGDTSKVFYDYNPDEANQIVVLETLTEESPRSEDIPLTALPNILIPIPITSSSSSKEPKSSDEEEENR